MAAAVLFTAGTLLTSCSKDEEAPVITLNGGDTQEFDLGAAADPGATVTDNNDEGLTATSDWSSMVKTNEVNTYTVNYTATDEAGNEGEAKKTVKIRSNLLAGTYSVTDIVSGSSGGSFDGTYTYNVTITQSGTDYNKLVISNFGGFGTTISATATVLGQNMTIPATTLVTPFGDFPVSGTGNYDGAGKKITTITYSAGTAGNGSMTLTKL